MPTVGVETHEQMKARMLAIASGEHVPAADEPKRWYVPGAAAAYIERLEEALGEWQPIATLPATGQALVTDEDPAELLADTDPRYGAVELVNLPMLKDGRLLNQNSGNYAKPGTWKWWRPAPPMAFANKV